MPAVGVLSSLLCLAACGAPGPVRHVSTTGTDAGDCRRSPCLTIGYAVRRAARGDTVAVAAGTYHEAVAVTKQLTLVGRGATIDAAGQTSPPNGVRISGDSAAGSRVIGFTIRNAGLEGIYAVKTSRVTIEGDTLFGNDAYGRDNPICRKYQSDCGEAIHLQAVTHSVVRGNVLHHNMGGVLLTDEDGPTAENLIAGNTITESPTDCGITLASHWLDTITFVPARPEVAGVYHNAVRGNTVTSSGGVGIGIFAAGPGAAAWGNVVEENTVTKSEFSGLAIHGHFKGQNLDGNVLRNNTLAGNGIDVENPAIQQSSGISVFAMGARIRGTVISGNRISDEHHGIIALRMDSIAGLSSNVIHPAVAVPVAILAELPAKAKR